MSHVWHRTVHLPQALTHLNRIENILGPLLIEHLPLALVPTVLHFKKLVNVLKQKKNGAYQHVST